MAKRVRSIEGFTLVEMLVVLAVLALVIGISVPMLRGERLAVTTETVAREVQMLLWRARMNAIAQGSNSAIVIDVSGRKLHYDPINQMVSIPETMIPTLFIGQELIASKGEAILVFFPDGASSGAKLEIIDQHGNGSSVLVPWLTGIPTLSKIP